MNVPRRPALLSLPGPLPVALLKVLDGRLIGDASALGERVPSQPLRLARLTDSRCDAWRGGRFTRPGLGWNVLNGRFPNLRVPGTFLIGQPAFDVLEFLGAHRSWFPLKARPLRTRSPANGVVLDFFVNHHDIPVVRNMSEDAWATATPTDPCRFIVFQHKIHVVGRQIVSFDMLHVAAGGAVPDDLGPFLRPFPSLRPGHSSRQRCLLEYRLRDQGEIAADGMRL